jgi:hypothetical protein
MREERYNLMRTVLTPSLAKLINAGREAVLGQENKDELLKAINEVEKFLADYEALFGILRACFFQDKETKTLLEYLEATYGELKKNLKDLRTVTEKGYAWEFNPVIHKIEESAGKLVSAMRELKEADEKEAVESPMPIVNAVIRTAFNIAAGHEKRETLARWLPLLVDLIARMDKQIDRFAGLHREEKEIAETARSLLKDMKEGAGALLGYLKEKKPVYLADAMKLLKYPSRNIVRLFRLMDRVSVNKGAFSRIVALEEFHRAYEGWKEGRVDWKIVESSCDSLQLLAGIYDDILAGIKNFPLFFALQNAWSAAQINMIRFRGFFDSFVKRLKEKPRDLDMNALKTHFENYSQIIARLTDAMEGEIRKVSLAPHIEELKELVGRAVNDGIVLEYCARRFQFFAQAHREILAEFGRAAEIPGAAAEVKDVHELLVAQGEGIDELLLFLEDSDKKHLYEGMARIEKALPGLLEIQKGVQKTLQEKLGKGKGQKIACIKCGAENVSSDRKCKKCAALLPFAVEEGAGLETLGAFEGAPVNIARIEDLAAGFDEGTVTASELSHELKSYLNKLHGIKSDYEGRTRASLASSGNPDIKEWSSEFSKNLHAMIAGLETMLMFTSNPDFLYQGLQAFSAAAAELGDIRQMVRGGL